MELCNKYIFILGLPKFDSEIESTIFTLARHLANDNHVFYIENPYTWKDVLLGRNSKELKRRKGYFFSGSDDVIDTDHPTLKVVVMPPMMSINWLPEGKLYRTFLKMNQEIMRQRVERLISKYSIPNYIFINSFNFYYPDLGKMLSPDLLVYHCVDPLVFSVDRKHGLLSEEKIVKESNLVVCTSKRLYEEKIQLNRNTFFVPNAADIKHSSKALEPGIIVHEYLDNIKRPIVGYFGNIERRLDYNLLNNVTEANPEVSFVFAGPVSKEFIPSWFYERSNIHLTGPVPYEQMPRVLKGFDVAMIPFKKDEVSATIFPLKLFEYLGAGRPVVATDFNPDLEDFTASTVAYCNSAASFSDAIRTVLNGDYDQLREKRLAVAAQNTWEKRSSEFGALINDYIIKMKQEKTSEKVCVA
jgi:teichuronic acid biosynthesis glycosyltransferase TuaH